MARARAGGALAHRWLASAAFALPVLLSGCGPTSIDKAFAAAAANVGTPRGKAYDQQIGKLLAGAEFREIVLTCRRETEGPKPPFSVLLRLSTSGEPTESEIWPVVPLSQCVRDSMLSFSFPPPPEPAFWIQVEVRV